MSEHHELISEMPSIERMTTQDRLKHAKKRRSQQLKKWNQYEKHVDKEHSKKRKSGQTAAQAKKIKKQQRRIVFAPNIALLEAAARNDLEEVRQLLVKGVKPDLTNDDGLSPLHQCCIDDRKEMLLLLLEYGANVNSKDSEHWTPLHAAATCRHEHLCRYLIERGADLLAVNDDGNMPYDICEDEATLDVIETEMTKRGITQEAIDNKRLASENYVLDDLEKLAAANNSLEFRDHVGATPLHIASANGYFKVAQYLLDHHVAVHVKDKDSWQPIHAAAYFGQPYLVDLLVENGADIDAKTKAGETPFDLCEDAELKQKILDVKDEIETNRANRGGMSSLIKHRLSSRSASLKRSSLRGDKARLSLKEAKEEALHFGLRLLQDEEDIKEVDEDKENVPATNIDDVKIILEFVDDQHNSAQEGKPLTHQNVVVKKEATKPSVEQSVPSSIPTDVVSQTMTQSTTHSTKSQQETRHVKSPTTPTPSSSDIIELQKQITKKNTHENQSNNPPIPPKPTPSTSDTTTRPHVAPDNRSTLQGRHNPQSNNSGSTLNDLKKHRSENRRDTLDAQVQSMFVERANSSWNSPYSTSPNDKTSNGHNNNNTNNYTQEPVKRFVAPSNVAIVGGQDKQLCCVVM